jgi:hypothetical protein
VAACETVPATDRVPTREVAIKLAQQTCDWSERLSQYFEKWHAQLHQGIWHVWLSLEPGVQEEPRSLHDAGYDPGTDFLDIHIHSSDGNDDGCVMIVR